MSAEEKVLQRVFGGEELQHAQVALFESFFKCVFTAGEKHLTVWGKPHKASGLFFLSLMKLDETSHRAW